MDAIAEYFAGPNLPATALLLLTAIYWLLVIVGGLGVDLFDFDFDVDADVDIEAELPGADGLEPGASVLEVILGFFYLGRIPTTIVMSVFSLVFWLATVYANRYWNPELGIERGIWIWPSCAIASLLGTKALLFPTLGFFDGMNGKNEPKPNRLLGLHGKVTSSEVTEQFGQVTIEQNGPPIVLNVYCGEMDRFKRGDLVTLTQYNPDKNTYLIEPFAEKK